MTGPSDLRSRKRLATRRAISQAADRLFFEKGFENVTVDEIAAAAEVGRMTVFNYFPRKEDMFFDRGEEWRETILGALYDRDPEIPSIDILCGLAQRLIAEGAPYLEFSNRSENFVKTVEQSQTLQARARTIRDELTQEIAEALARSAHSHQDDPVAHLVAGILMATWAAAFVEGHRVFRRTRKTEAAQAAFLAIVERGAIGIRAAVKDTPLVSV